MNQPMDISDMVLVGPFFAKPNKAHHIGL